METGLRSSDRIELKITFVEEAFRELVPFGVAFLCETCSRECENDCDASHPHGSDFTVSRRAAVLIPIAIFAGTYLVLAIGRLPGFRIDRTGAAIIGATLMIASGTLTV